MNKNQTYKLFETYHSFKTKLLRTNQSFKPLDQQTIIEKESTLDQFHELYDEFHSLWN